MNDEFLGLQSQHEFFTPSIVSITYKKAWAVINCHYHSVYPCYYLGCESSLIPISSTKLYHHKVHTSCTGYSVLTTRVREKRFSFTLLLFFLLKYC
jgi:hypothetical protein